MVYFILIAEFLFLFFTSNYIFKSLFSFIYVLTRSRKLSMGVVTTLFFSGTFVHEFAHYLMARILFVKAVSFNMIPHFEESHIRLGSVEIVKTDPLRRLLIGLAPIVLGFAILYGIIWWATGNIIFSQLSKYQLILLALLIYTVFVVSNTMFSSKKDVEGAGLFIFLGMAMFGVAWLFDIPILKYGRGFLQNEFIEDQTAVFIKLLLIPVGINGVFAGLFAILKRRN